MNRIAPIRATALALTILISFASAPRAQDKAPAQPTPASAQDKPASAQEKPTAAQEKPPEAVAGLSALNEALKTPDVAKRFAALQKVIQDYPASDVARAAKSQLTSQLASSLKANASAVAFVAGETEKSKDPSDYAGLAQNLLDAGVLLDRAEALAEKGLAIDEQAYLAARKQAAAAASPKIVRTIRDGVSYYAEAVVWFGPQEKATEPAEADLRGDFKETRLRLLATLGLICAKQGKTAAAEKTLKEAWAADIPNPSKRAVGGALADIAAKAGNTREEIDYRAGAYVLGGASSAARQTLEDLYRKAHGGTTDGLEDVLDAAYRRAVTPIEVKPYDRPKTARPRTVLAELFTGAGCPPCVGVDLAFDGAMERFAGRDLAVVVYHQHIPRPDPMTNPATDARRATYDVDGVPTFAIDGVSTVGGGPASDAAEIFEKQVRPAIEKRLAAPPEARLDLAANREASAVRVHVRVSSVKRRSRSLRLQVALVEEMQRYSGPNGVRLHPMVVRSLAGKAFRGFEVPAGGATIDWTFDLTKIVADNTKAIDDFLAKPPEHGDKPSFADGRRDAIDPNHLMVVAFVQDEDPAQDKPAKAKDKPAKPANEYEPPSHTRVVLQAASVKVPAPATGTSK